MRLIDALLQNAATSGDGKSHDLRGQSKEISFYVIGIGTITAGAIQLETADTPDYSGTWAPLGDAIALSTLSGGKQQITQLTGCFNAVRARISTAVTGGGSASVRLVAR